MAKDYWLIERKIKDGDKYFISDVKYSEKNSLLKKSQILSAPTKADYSRVTF